jgi:hypothetical protein
MLAKKYIWLWLCVGIVLMYLLSWQEIPSRALVVFTDVDQTGAFEVADAYSPSISALGKLNW